MWTLATASTAAIDKSNTTRIQLFPAGWFGAPDGSGPRWYLNAALAQQLIESARGKTNDYVFDYEHQSLNAPKASGPVPAAGWFSALTWVEDEGLFADVKWTQRAAALIQADEYRYVSPTFTYDEKGHVRELVNAALTNMPVLDGMRQVAASLMFFDNGEKPMNENLRLALCAILGLDTTADERAIQAGVEQLQNGVLSTANCSSVATLIAARDAQLAEKDRAITAANSQVAALSAARQAGNGNYDPTQLVPVAVVDDLRTQLASLSVQVNTDKVETLLQAALSDGRVLKGADETAMRALGKKDLAMMSQLIAARQPIQALSQMQTHGMALDDKGNPALDRDTLAVCSMFGLQDETQFAQHLAQEMGHGTD